MHNADWYLRVSIAVCEYAQESGIGFGAGISDVAWLMALHVLAN